MKNNGAFVIHGFCIAHAKKHLWVNENRIQNTKGEGTKTSTKCETYTTLTLILFSECLGPQITKTLEQSH